MRWQRDVAQHEPDIVMWRAKRRYSTFLYLGPRGGYGGSGARCSAPGFQRVAFTHWCRKFGRNALAPPVCGCILYTPKQTARNADNKNEA